MNHWFLVGRDVMWFVVACGPIVCGNIAAKTKYNDGDHWLFLGFIWQAALLGGLYFGCIK